jgi:hypothetical protein
MKLTKERDDVELHRLQGQLKAIDDIIGLRNDVLNYTKGVQSGTMRKVG